MVVSMQVFNIRLNIPGMCSYLSGFTVAHTFIYATSFILGHLSLFMCSRIGAVDVFVLCGGINCGVCGD